MVLATRQISSLVGDLLKVLQSETGLSEDSFNSGCSERKLKNADKVMGIALPNDFRRFLQLYDGQKDHYSLLFPPDQLVFLSLNEIICLWREFSDGSDDRFFNSFDQNGLTRNILEHAKRIPIAANEMGGCFLFIDYVPGPNGVDRQIVFNTNESDVVVVAPNITDLFATYERLLKKGAMKIVKQPSEYGQGYWFVGSTGEYLDWGAFKTLIEQ